MKNDVNLLNRCGAFVGGFGCAAMLAILLDAWGEAPTWGIVGLFAIAAGSLWITWDSIRGKLRYRKTKVAHDAE